MSVHVSVRARPGTGRMRARAPACPRHAVYERLRTARTHEHVRMRNVERVYRVPCCREFGRLGPETDLMHLFSFLPFFGFSSETQNLIQLL